MIPEIDIATDVGLKALEQELNSAGFSAGVHPTGVLVIEKLNSEKDLNLLCEADGKRVVVKIYNSAMEESDIRLQLQVQAEVSESGICPKIVLPLSFDLEMPRMLGEFAVSVTEFIPGLLLNRSTDFDVASLEFNALLLRVGQTVGLLTEKLAVVKTTARRKPLIWNFTQFDQVVRDLGACLDPAVVSEFADIVPSVSDSLQRALTPTDKWQVCHYDCNDDNILVLADGDVRVIDFGDVDLGPRVTDISICCCYVLINVFLTNPNVSVDQVESTVKQLLRGFRSAVTVSNSELALIPAMVVGRAVMSLCIQSSQREANPGNSEYLSASFVGSRRLLRFVRVLAFENFIKLFSPESFAAPGSYLASISVLDDKLSGTTAGVQVSPPR